MQQPAASPSKLSFFTGKVTADLSFSSKANLHDRMDICPRVTPLTCDSGITVPVPRNVKHVRTPHAYSYLRVLDEIWGTRHVEVVLPDDSLGCCGPRQKEKRSSLKPVYTPTANTHTPFAEAGCLLCCFLLQTLQTIYRRCPCCCCCFCCCCDDVNRLYVPLNDVCFQRNINIYSM